MDLQAIDLGDLEDRISTALGRLGELQAGTRVSSDAFFSEPFMQEHTEFESFAGFYEQAPWSLAEPTDVEHVSRDELNDYIAATTDFETWDAMKTQAAEEEIIDQIVS